MTMKFIDISGYQRGLDIPTVVKNGGLGAVVVKATEGVGWVDKSCDGFAQQCFAHGIPFGFYHFARNNNAASEAEYFRNNTKGYEHRGIPILDWEDGQSVDWVNAFVNRYHELTGIWPWVYGNAWRFNQGTVNPNCGRWIAGYPMNGITDINFGMNNPFPYAVNGGVVCAWQFSSSVRIGGFGGNLDGDVFYGDASTWAKYAGGGGTPSAPTAPSTTNAPSGSTLELAVAVMQGKYGNGDARKSAIVAIANSKRNSKANVDMLRKEAERQQRISDKLATIGSSVDETRAMVQLIDNKLEQHGTQITRLEAKVDEQERRITVLEKRCERHFGEPQ